MPKLHITPRLIVIDADRAIAFYRRVFGAEVVERFVDQSHVVHAQLRAADATFYLAEERRDWHNLAPASLGGSPVILELQVDNADVVAEALLAAGSEVIFPVADQFYGKREGRFRDPFGHVWIVSQTLEVLTATEIQRRMDRT
jgi:PhnB protein